jgi:DNA (cytosine-5)-methyltransferase 1
VNSRPRLLDVCCGAGGAAAGYARAGFEVVGVDNVAQPEYPFELIRGDALQVLEDREFVRRFDAVHASPPCQRWATATLSQRKAGKKYPDLISPLRPLLEATGLPWVLENVPQAPLRADLTLCGCQFGLQLEGVGQLRRERVFELSWKPVLEQMPHNHVLPAISIAGHGTPSWQRKLTGHITVAQWREVMGIAWVRDREALTEAIPPAYCEHVGRLLLDHLGERSVMDQVPPHDWQALFDAADHRPQVQHADALEWLGELEPESAKVIVFDPPYSRSTPVRGRDDGAAGRVYGPFSFLHKAMTAAARLLRQDGVMLIFGDAQLLPDLAYIASTCGLHYYTKYFWDRGRPGSGTMFRSCCDEVLVVARGVPDVVDRAAVPNIIHVSAEGRRPHPYFKPPEVFAHAFRRVCRPGDLVIDPFAGSASSRTAALELGCRWLGADIDPQYATTTQGEER